MKYNILQWLRLNEEFFTEEWSKKLTEKQTGAPTAVQTKDTVNRSSSHNRLFSLVLYKTEFIFRVLLKAINFEIKNIPPSFIQFFFQNIP